MDFRLAFTPRPFANKISHGDKLLLTGSCFTENIGNKLASYKFDVLQNPNGILFNPVSVADALTSYLDNKVVATDDLFYYNELYNSWQHHSRFSAPDAASAVEGINLSTAKANKFLKQADWVIVTLGSAWIYTLTGEALNAEPGAVAANNHKAPASWFHRRLMGAEEVIAHLDNALHRIWYENPKARFIFTISPVRHIREGFVENNRSKSILNLAVHTLCEKFEGVYYFPAYELVIDDLRDYRFFAEDMVHPNYMATNYVWEKFIDTCLDESSKQVMPAIKEINAAMAHKPFNPASEAHKKFCRSNLEKISRLEATYPHLDFESEKIFFGSFL